MRQGQIRYGVLSECGTGEGQPSTKTAQAGRKMPRQSICRYRATSLNHGETKRGGSATTPTDGTELGPGQSANGAMAEQGTARCGNRDEQPWKQHHKCQAQVLQH